MFIFGDIQLYIHMYIHKKKMRKSKNETQILFLFGSKNIFESKRSYYWKYGLGGGWEGPN